MTSKKQATSQTDVITDGKIVSSRHLVSESCAELSDSRRGAGYGRV